MANNDVRILKYDKDGRAVGIQKKRTLKPGQSKSQKGKSRSYDPRQDFDKTEVVVLNPPADMGVKAAAKGFVMTEQRRLGNLGLTVARIAVPAGKDVKNTVRTLKRTFSGVKVAPNHHFAAAAGPTMRTHARAAMRWKAAPASCGKGVRLGLIDSNVDGKHPAFRRGSVVSKTVIRRGKKAASGAHGTSVASMLIGTDDWGGLLPSAKLYAAGIFEQARDGRVTANAANIAAGIDWLVENNVHVINLSIAGADNPIVRAALDKAQKKGIAVVAAAGNWGARSRPAFPAAYKDVLAVTAVRANLKPYDQANRGNYIDFAAPGVRIWTAVPKGGRFRTGTSFATPYITALAALQVQRGKKVTPEKLRKVLRKHSKDLGKQGKDDTFGWGVPMRPPHCR